MSHSPITLKQKQLINHLLFFRFLTRHQLQIFLHHNDPRRIKFWLKDLLEKGYIKRIYSEKVGEHSTPAIYYLDNKSRQILKERKDLKPEIIDRVWKEKKKSERFINHNLFFADFYLSLQSFVKQKKGTLRFYTKDDMKGFNFLPLPLPDAYYTIEDTEKKTSRYFMEVCDEGVPKGFLKQRIEKYIEFYDSGLWQRSTNYSFPSIYLIYPDETLKNSLSKFIKEKLEEEEIEISFYLTTKKEFYLYRMQEKTWKKVE